MLTDRSADLDQQSMADEDIYTCKFSDPVLHNPKRGYKERSECRLAVMPYIGFNSY